MSKTTTKRRTHSSNTSDSSVSSVSSNYDNGIRHGNNVNDVSRINYNSSSSGVDNNSSDGNDTSIIETTIKKKKELKYKYKQLEFQENVKLCMEYFWRGVCDAFTWPTSLITIYG